MVKVSNIKKSNDFDVNIKFKSKLKIKSNLNKKLIMKDSPSVVIELDHVWKTYKVGNSVVHACKDLCLKIFKGEFIAVTGPSGSGKSTAMNLIGCLDVPTKGVIKLSSEDISKFSESKLATVRGKTIGFIFQKFNLINTLSARENVMLPMIFQNVSESDRMDRSKELLNLVGLGDRMDHLPSELSGGQQQRVAIARALAMDPDVILADEPTGNLDSKSGLVIMNYLKKLNELGKTIVLVTHDSYVANFANKVVVLKDGEIDTDTNQVYSK